MMLRLIYRSLLRLHPPRFRRRFGGEMLGIFDQAGNKMAAARLLGDGVVSLARQWALRSEFWDQPAAPALSAGSGVPAFYTFPAFKPRKGALLNGAALSLAIFCGVCFIMKYGVNQSVYMPFAGVVSENIAQNPRLSPHTGSPLRESEASTAVQIPSRPQIFNHGESGSASRLRQLLTKSAPPARGTQSVPSATVAGQPVVIHTPQPTAVQGIPTASPAIEESRPTPVSDQVLKSYVGVYKVDSPEALMVTVTMHAGHLNLEVAGEPMTPLIPLSQTKFVPSSSDDIWVEFSNLQDGTAQRMEIHSGNRHLTAQRQ